MTETLVQQPQTPPAAAAPAATYTERSARFSAAAAALNRTRYRVANLSAGLGLAALVVFGVAFAQGSGPLYLGAAVLVLAFVAAFLRQGVLDGRHARQALLAQLNEEGLLRLRRDWAHLPLREPQGGDVPAHPAATDLDLAGHASLLHLLGVPATPVGQWTLRTWLLGGASPAEVRQRQAAVADLAPRNDLRDALAATAATMGAAQPEYERFLAWAEREPVLPRHPWLLVWLPRALALLTLALLVAQLVGATPYPLWLLLGIANLVYTRQVGGATGEVLEAVTERRGIYAAYADLFAYCTAEAFDAPALVDVQRRLSAAGLRADLQLRRLGRISDLDELRHSMIFPVIQALTLWTFHVHWLLERWQRVAGPHARSWLAALGEFEALAALATLRHDHPAWSFPEALEGAPAGQAPVLAARDLGHPLLAPEVCVANDVAVGPPGTLLLVTGSNMSGKSTLLRALGVNIVLAQAGSVVCAAELRLAPLTLATSMRISDSLEQGVSYFLAELLRLKQVVEAAQQVRTEGTRTLFFLLDELLHGTNTHERQIAARHILTHLLRLGATGAVSTHDLSLADAVGVSEASTLVHFTETFTRGPDGPTMAFDYRLRPGLATSTNALKLMEIVGLPLDAPEG